MFIRLKKPTYVVRGKSSGSALPREILFNLSRIGTVSFGTNGGKLSLYDEQKDAYYRGETSLFHQSAPCD